MKDIFISYKSEDIEKARKVRDHLEKDGFSVWMAPDSITGGASYAAEIPPAIDGAKVFVLVFTKNTQGSKWVSRELDRAINGNKIIIPLMLDDCELNAEFSFYLSNVQRYPAFENYKKSLAKMTDEIRQYIAPQVQEEQPEIKKEEAPKPEKPKKEKKEKAPKNHSDKKIKGFIVLGIIFVIIIASVMLNVMNTVTIAGVKMQRDEKHPHFYKKEITAEDVNKIAKLKDLSQLSFEECTINAENIGVMVDDTMHNIRFKNCGLTKEQIATLDLSGNKLSSLDLSGSQLDDLDIIEGQQENLSSLHISDTKVSDISLLADFTKLGEISADNCGIKDISSLANLEKLTTLRLAGNEIESLKPFENLTKLDRIDLSRNKLKNLDGLEKSLELNTLVADDNEIENIDGLTNATRLFAVSLKNNNISDISLLAKSKENLGRLYLGGNNIEDISTLEKCTSLRNLDIGGNAISDLSVIKNFKELNSLDASSNNLEGKLAIENMPALKYIVLADNKITEFRTAFEDEMGAILILDKNPLTKLETGYTNRYGRLILGETELEDYSEVYNAKGNLMMHYSEKLDFVKLREAEYQKITLIGVPLDKQVDVKDMLVLSGIEFKDEYDYDKTEIMPDDSYGIIVY